MKAIHALLLACALAPAAASAQQPQPPQPLVGAWTLVSDVADPAGKKSPTLGREPHGTLIFTAAGRYALVMSRAGLPRFANNNRDRGTDDENRAVVAGTLAHSGRYSVSGGNFTWNIETSTFPNWTRTSQTKAFKVVGDELRYISPGATNAPGTTQETVWKRAK